MKLLIVEYINGGGFLGQELPASLAIEGRLMLQALLNETKSLADLDVQLLLDPRCQEFALPEKCQAICLEAERDFLSQFAERMQYCDAVWPIAPETDGILATLAEIAQDQGKCLLVSAPEAIRLCGDKFATFGRLRQFGIPTVDSKLVSSNQFPEEFPCVLKPRDGVGCEGSFIVADLETYTQVLTRIAQPDLYLQQPLIEGEALSLSCLFKHGQAWLLSCNRQLVGQRFAGFQLNGCEVNITHRDHGFYQDLINRIARSIPDLWGYIGIDLISSVEHGPLVLEINPRLTTSYTALQAATGINVAEWVLKLLSDEIRLPTARQRCITVTLH